MNTVLNACEKWLSEMNVKTIARPTCLMVSRDDVVNNLGDTDEVLKALREATSSSKLFWAGKDDDYLYLESF
jgi:hypothetical protein